MVLVLFGSRTWFLVGVFVKRGILDACFRRDANVRSRRSEGVSTDSRDGALIRTQAN